MQIQFLIVTLLIGSSLANNVQDIGWTSFNTKSFKIIHQTASYRDAELICDQNKGSMIIINSQQKSDVLQSFIVNQITDMYVLYGWVLIVTTAKSSFDGATIRL